MSARDVWAVVPVKDVDGAKQRLADAVPAALRPGLALAMLEDVLSALAAVPELAGIVVVTRDAAARTLAQRYKARVLSDNATGGHTAVVAGAARVLAAEGRGAMLQVPGDLPLLAAHEISAVIAQHGGSPAFTIVPAHDDYGSNAVLVSPPDAVPLTFGDDSFFPHLAAARARGIEPLVVRSPGIARDIDRPDDLRAFARLGSSTRTRDYLERHGLIAVLAPAQD